MSTCNRTHRPGEFEPARVHLTLRIRGDTLVGEIVLTGCDAPGVQLADGEINPTGEVIIAAGTTARRACCGARCPAARCRDEPDRSPHVSITLPYHGPPKDVPPFQVMATLHSAMANPVTDPPDLQILAGGQFPTNDSQLGRAVAATAPEARPPHRRRPRRGTPGPDHLRRSWTAAVRPSRPTSRTGRTVMAAR